MEKTIQIEYWDDFSLDSSALAAAWYGVEIAGRKNVSECEDLLTVRGAERDVDAFAEAVESGDVEPMCGKRDLSDEEYSEWLAAASAELKEKTERKAQ